MIGEAKSRATIVAEDWSKEAVGIHWDTDGGQKGPERKGRDKSLTSTMKRFSAVDGCVILI